MRKKYVQFLTTKWFIALACLVLGAAVVMGIRFANYKSDAIHYHANFALYINGQREEFVGNQYYSETEMCALNETMVPAERAHMHDNVNSVVHVEDHAVTWGQFFTNLGWTMGATSIVSPDGVVYSENGNNKLSIVIDGQDYTDLGGVANTVIKDQSKLLVSFGNQATTQLKQQYDSIPSTAAHYDVTNDPKSCSGQSGSTMSDRFKSMF